MLDISGVQSPEKKCFMNAINTSPGSGACHWIEPSRGDMAKSLQNPFFPNMNLFKLPLFL